MQENKKISFAATGNCWTAKAGSPKRVLVFLSPKSYGPPKTGKPDVHLTYEDDIAPWLKTIEPNIKPISLRGTVQQYLQIIQDLSGVQLMANQELIKLIERPENIQCAWEVSDSIGEADICSIAISHRASHQVIT